MPTLLDKLQEEGKHVLIPILESDEKLFDQPRHIVLPAVKAGEDVQLGDLLLKLHCGQPILTPDQYKDYSLGGRQHLKYDGTPFSLLVLPKPLNDRLMRSVYLDIISGYLKEEETRVFVTAKLRQYHQLSGKATKVPAKTLVQKLASLKGVEWSFCARGGIILYSEISFPDGAKKAVEGDLRSPQTMALRKELYDEDPKAMPQFLFTGDIERQVRRYGGHGVPLDRWDELRAAGARAIAVGLQNYDAAKHVTTFYQYLSNLIHEMVRDEYRVIMGYDDQTEDEYRDAMESGEPVQKIVRFSQLGVTTEEGDQIPYEPIDERSSFEDEAVFLADLKKGRIESKGKVIRIPPKMRSMTMKLLQTGNRAGLANDLGVTEAALYARFHRLLDTDKKKRGKKRK